MNTLQIVFIVLVLVLLSVAWVQFGLPYVKTWNKARSLRKAHAYLKNDECDKAVAELENIIDLRDLNSPVFVSLFTLLISREEYKKAEEILDRVPDDIKRSDNYLLQRGYLFYLQRDFPAARSLFESIIQKGSEYSPLALSNLGALIVQEGNNPREAINLLKQALSTNKGNTSNYGIYFNLSLAYLQLKEFNEAIVHAEVGLDLLPKDGFGSNKAYAHHILSLGYKGMGKMKDARKELMLAIELSPHGAGRQALEKELESL
jgi:tetratricopeptide (TPR) repeat protein